MVEPSVRNNLPLSSSRVLHVQLHMLLVAFVTRACCMLIVESGSTQAFRVTSEKMVSLQSVLICVAIPSKVQDIPLALTELTDHWWVISPGCQGAFECHQTHLLYQPPLPVVYCVQTC